MLEMMRKCGLIVILLALLVPGSMQLRMDRVLGRINEEKGPFLGLILSSASDEKMLLDSGYFVVDSSTPNLNFAGRQFNTGKFNDVPAVYVVAKSPLAHVSATVQIMLNKFKIRGIIDYGSAATVSESLAIADVAVLEASAFTGVWNWKNWEKTKELEGEELPMLKFGDFNVPKPGQNKLASIEYEHVLQYTPRGSDKHSFWFPAHRDWLHVASHLKDITLDTCVESTCASEEPKMVHGVKGSSSDIFLSNQAYAQFLNNQLQVYTVDRNSAATASTAIANGVPHIVFRAATNRPGAQYNPGLAALGAKNALKLVSEFINRIADEKTPKVCYY